MEQPKAGRGRHRWRGPRRRAPLAEKHSREPGLSPEEDGAHVFDAFDASFKDDFQGVPVFVPFQRKKPCECGECGRLFKHRTDLGRHSADVTKHREKPFTCGQCGSNLFKHQKTLTGEKPYDCKECGKAFAYSSCLIRHRKRHPR